MKKIFFIALIAISLKSQNLEGIYQTSSFWWQKKVFVEFFKFNNKYYAYAIKNIDNSPAKKDSHNPNPELRNRSDKGVVFLYDLIQVSPNVYENGKTYNFYDGKTYYVKIYQKDNKDINFFVSIDPTGFIGKTFLWKHLDNDFIKENDIEKPNMQDVLKTLSDINE
ncbi:DUF2147 domain-containing protein [Helicobacter sp. 13S00477-4]|uniref:DUF2147 domain-containing protein n=1 Tax=Helicobacter sp. 13S00477-4 TaxID=1905759 RepID=UPI000BA56872|nr:DUF2147 domain-containing protein [Helicobacter sp. 13S00477-4]PAF52682.1 hypothetical protein BKH44_00415 [Helicobacter sp. 13S00477-4]